MIIKNTNISFGQKYPTIKVLEITSQKILDSEGVLGYMTTLRQIKPDIPKYPGHLGFRYYACLAGKDIMDKYPEIKKASEEINNIAAESPLLNSVALGEKVQPIIDRFGKEVDIII